MAQAPVQPPHHGRIGPLLRPENKGGAVLAVQGIIHVAHQPDAHARQGLSGRLGVDPGDLFQRTAAGHERISIFI